MVVFDEKLWQLRVETDRLFYTQVRDSEFKSLRDILQPEGSHQSALSCIEEKDRLILSFVLATSLMHFVEGPWLQAPHFQSRIVRYPMKELHCILHSTDQLLYHGAAA